MARTGRHRPLGPRHELPRSQRAARADRRGRQTLVQPAGQIADLGGGALMGAFGILAALAERERSGRGRLVDVSMFDGALSWLALVAARYLCDGEVPRRGGIELAGGLICYRPYACRDGWVTLGALEPKFWQAWCRGVGREDLIERQFDAPARGPCRGRARVPRACPGGVAGVRLEPRLLPRAGAGSRRGARVGARASAADSRGGRAARRGRVRLP